ncbi:MAG: efflux RND transporter periplasmic adaptor subunit [Balneolaceae bacterium]
MAMKKAGKRILTTGLVLMILAALAWPKVKPLFSSPAEESDDSPSGNLMQVEAVELEPETLDDRIYASGTVQANEIVDLRSEISGKIVDIHFEEGRSVAAGQLLLKINDSELQAQRRRAQFQLSLAEQREERQQRLLERGGISQEEYDAIVNEVNVLRAEIDLVDAQIEKTEIRAPFDGVVGLKYVSTGSFISSDTQIATLNDINPVKIDFSVPERYSTSVEPGDRLQFDVQGRDSTFTGEVYAVEPRIDRQTRTLQIRAVSDNSDQLLIPGAFASIELILDSVDNALMLPTIAVIPDMNRQKVFLYRNGEVEEVSVTTGLRTESSVRITDGVAPGDTVLTTGLLQVRPGMPVELTRVFKSSGQQ